MDIKRDEITERVYHYLFAYITYWDKAALRAEVVDHLCLTRQQVVEALAKLEAC